MNLLLPMDLPTYTKTWQMNLLFLADEPSLANGPPFGWWTPQVHKIWQMNLLFPAGKPPLADGPPVQRRDALNTSTHSLAEKTYVGQWAPWVHKTWQMNLLWPMDPLGTQNLADKPTFSGRQTFCSRWTYFGQWTPQVERRDALADKYTLADGPPTHTHKWRMAISHCYWHLVVKNNNFTLLLTSSGQEWQFHIATDIQWSRMAISHCYWHPVVKNGNFTLLLTSSGQEWQFHIAIDIHWSRMAI